MRYRTIQCNILQYRAIPMQYHKIQCNTIRYNSIPCSIIRCHATQCNNMHFWPKNGNFRQLGPYNSLPNSWMGTHRKTEGIQIYLRIWGCYDPVESGPSETKKGGLYGCSVKKSDFQAKNGPLYPPRSLSSNMINTKMLSFWCPVMMVAKKMEAVHNK